MGVRQFVLFFSLTNLGFSIASAIAAIALVVAGKPSWGLPSVYAILFLITGLLGVFVSIELRAHEERLRQL